MENIFSLIKNYEESFLYQDVEIVEGYQFDQLETIKDIHLYYSGKFKSGQSDDKYFFNIVKHRVKNASKNFDIDSKDVLFKTKRGGDATKAWIVRRDAQRWLEDRRIGEPMNEVGDALPKYGSVIVKRVPTEQIFEVVDLRNIKNDPTAKNLNDSWVIEDHFYTPSELLVYKDVWDNIELAIKSYKTYFKENYVDETFENIPKGDAQYIHVKEFYGDVPETYFDEEGDPNNYIKGRFIVISPESQGGKNDSTAKKDKEGLILFKEKWDTKKDLYKEVHYDRIEGRWLGVGLVEDGFELQALKNKQVNQLILAQDLANLILFQSADDLVAQNLLTDVENGEVLNTSGITVLDTRTRDLGGYNVLNQEIETLYNNLSNTFEVTTGESLPSGTPFRLGALIDRNAQKYFVRVREKIGMFWKEVFEDWILPELMKDLNKQHILEITNEDEVKKLNAAINKQTSWQVVKDLILKEGRKPTLEEIETLESVLEERSRSEVFLEIPNGWYKDIEKEVYVVVTDENANKQVETQELITVLQLMSQDPTLAQHPLFKKILDWVGLSKIDLPPQDLPKQGLPDIMQALGQVNNQEQLPQENG